MGCEFWIRENRPSARYCSPRRSPNQAAQVRLVPCAWIASKTQMTRPHRGQELYRRSLAIAGAVVALASTSCGSPVAVASNPTPGPVTADSVRTAFSNSTMDNAHFKLHGTLIKNRTYYPVTGDGVLQLRPVEALVMNVSLTTYNGKPTR